jgi:hypothetical protein
MAKIMAQLKELAFARSGDKGDLSNIGLMAKNRECYEVIRKEVTPERVKSHFKGIAKGDVKIYEMSNIDSLEVLLYQALGGGATRTLRLDQTGKSMGQALLRMEIEVDENILKKAKAAEEAIYQKYRSAR